MSHLPSIAIVGGFDSGKSTTFNALCDGRDISPRRIFGGDIMTNAILIAAENIIGDETKDGLAEWAEVSFKTPEELAMGLASILRRPLMDSTAFRKNNAKLSDEQFTAAMSTDDGFSELVDLDNDECRAALTDAANALWGKWQKNRASLSDEELYELRIATLRLRFYGSAEYREMTSRMVFPIDSFQNLLTVPTNWMIRWENGSDSQFMLDEVVFIFVESVLVRIHSKNLRRLGCRIMECPSLSFFGNAYDIGVVHRTIEKSDMVLYLTHGQMSIGQYDLESIRTISKMGMEGKIQVIANLYHSQEFAIDVIISATKNAFVDAGLDIKVHPFNARLAFLSMQGALLLDPARKADFTAIDEANMRVDAKDKTGTMAPTTMWVKMVSRLGVTTELEDVEAIDSLDAESVALVRRESMLDNLISSLEQELAG